MVQTYFKGKVERHFFKKQIAHPLFPDPNNGAAFVPESEISHAGSGE
jgi:hypothetical protein